jgi:hypothetical protein
MFVGLLEGIYTDMDKLTQDTRHWQNLRPPLSPDEKEVKIYEDKCRGFGPVCLLGMTKELIHICDYMVDLNPMMQKKPVIARDWADLSSMAEVIIGDGVLNLAGMSLADGLRRKCDRLVCRVFRRKFDGMKYATHFPSEFPGAKEVVETQPGIVMVTWDV